VQLIKNLENVHHRRALSGEIRPTIVFHNTRVSEKPADSFKQWSNVQKKIEKITGEKYSPLLLLHAVPLRPGKSKSSFLAYGSYTPLFKKDPNGIFRFRQMKNSFGPFAFS
jgi:hypothetical protein